MVHPLAGGQPIPSVNAMAILGMLNLVPMTAYGVAEQLGRALSDVWASSRRLMLGEPKRLAEKGLVEAIEAADGSRADQQWAATPAGREALEQWLRSAVAPTQTNNELALRVLYADAADKDTLLQQIRERRRQLAVDAERGRAQVTEYLTTGGPLPDRLHLTTALSRLMVETKAAELTWLDWLEDEVRSWADTRTPRPIRHRRELRAQFERLAEFPTARAQRVLSGSPRTPS